MRKEFNFTALVKSSAKEAWENRPRDWSSNCVVEIDNDEHGCERVSVRSRSGSFDSSSTDHRVFDAFMNEIFKICIENKLDSQGNQTYCVYDDGEYEVLVHTNYDFWVPRFHSMIMKEKEKNCCYIFQQTTSILSSIVGETVKSTKALTDCFFNSIDKFDKLHDIATKDIEKRHICEMIEYLQDATEMLNIFVKSFSNLTNDQNKSIEDDIHEAVAEKIIEKKACGIEILSDENLQDTDFMKDLKDQMQAIIKKLITVKVDQKD